MRKLLLTSEKAKNCTGLTLESTGSLLKNHKSKRVKVESKNIHQFVSSNKVQLFTVTLHHCTPMIGHG